MIRVAHPHNVPTIPILDDFDPDTYGITIETPEPCMYNTCTCTPVYFVHIQMYVARTCMCTYIHVHVHVYVYH